MGASIFSPRPGRGYRFHSLQVEIIAILSRRLRRKSSRQLIGDERRFDFVLNALLEKSFAWTAQDSISPMPRRSRLLCPI
jgi:hypothetical protein